MKHYVIIGNGIAAAGCIEGIRSIDKKGSITVVSEENHPVYCRPLISYYLQGKTDTEKMNYRGTDFYEKNVCSVLYGIKAGKINKRPKTVLLNDGSELPYSSICVTTGSSPFVPPFKGLDTVLEKYSFMTLDDAEALKKVLSPDKKVLIAGAGLIGLKCAEGIWGHVGEITVFDLADRVLSSILDNECAGRMQSHLESHGIKFLLSDTAERFEKNKAYMKSGEIIDFDILVLTVGVKANLSLVKDAGGLTNRGIIVDGRMQTSLPSIYCAGDCAEIEDITTGSKRVLAILPNAYLGGYTAGVNMAGGSAVFDNAIPMNSIGFFGLHAMTAGSYFDSSQGGECFEVKTENKLKRLYIKGGLLTGFILLGETERAGIYTSLIRNRTPLDQIDFEMLKEIATSAAFSAESRRQKFGVLV